MIEMVENGQEIIYAGTNKFGESGYYKLSYNPENPERPFEQTFCYKNIYGEFEKYNNGSGNPYHGSKELIAESLSKFKCCIVEGEELQFGEDKDLALLTHKKRQLDVIQEFNPMKDDYHNGIRLLNDIKTFDEAFESAKTDTDFSDGLGQIFTYPDVSMEDLRAVKNGSCVTVYRGCENHEINVGDFVATSYRNAYDYAGSAKNVVKITVPKEDIAWINIEEGVYVGPLLNKGEITVELDEEANRFDLYKDGKYVNSRLHTDCTDKDIEDMVLSQQVLDPE
jgi:hypothetical protein